MFVKQIHCVLAGATKSVALPALPFLNRTMPLSVSIGRALAAAALLVSPALITPVHAAGLTIADPGNVCGSWSLTGTTLTCNPAVTTPGVPVCSLSANPPTISASALVTLTASCTNTDANTAWSWSGTGTTASTQGTSPQTQSVTVGATTTFSVTATNGTGASNQKNATVTLSTGGGGGGGGGGGAGISCPGFNKTIVLNFPYTIGKGQQIQTTQGMNPGDIIVATFTTPAAYASGAPYTGGIPYIAITNNSVVNSPFRGTVSTTPCATTGSSKGDSQSVSWNFPVQANTTYYVNITGADPLSVKLTPK